MERYRIRKLPSGFWSVWQGDNWINAALPSRKAAEEFLKAWKSGSEEEFDLPAFLLNKVYSYMDEDDIAGWTWEEAQNVVHDIRLYDGIEADVDEVFETIAEFIAQDAEEEQL